MGMQAPCGSETAIGCKATRCNLCPPATIRSWRNGVDSCVLLECRTWRLATRQARPFHCASGFALSGRSAAAGRSVVSGPALVNGLRVSGLRASGARCSTDKRVAFGVLDGLHGKVNVELRPVQVIGARLPNGEDLPNRRVSKPRKAGKRHEQLTSRQQEPESSRRHVGHLNLRSAPSTPHGCHPCAPPQVEPQRRPGPRSTRSCAPIRPSGQYAEAVTAPDPISHFNP